MLGQQPNGCIGIYFISFLRMSGISKTPAASMLSAMRLPNSTMAVLSPVSLLSSEGVAMVMLKVPASAVVRGLQI